MRDFIHEYPSAISQDVCARLVQKFEYYEKNPGKEILVQDKFTTDGGLPNEKRTKEASVIYLNPEILQSEDADFFRLVQFCIEGMSRCISSYISALQPISIAPIQVDQVDLMRYERGQGFYGRHVDAGSRALQHRVLSFVVYLNDVEKGGETEFPLQGRIVKPETGKVVVFPSSFCFLHGSKMTISGQKYVLVAFSSFGM